MDVDDEGNLWIAMWDGWSLRKYSPNGVLLNEVAVPFPRPTSCLCLGNDPKRLIVTSARIRVSNDLLEKHPLAGGVISLPLD